MKTRPIEEGDYVTPIKPSKDVYFVLGVDNRGELELEEVYSGNSYDMCEARHYKRCPKPKSFKQEHKALCQKYGMLVAGCCTQQTAAFTRFSRELTALLVKYGSNICV